MPIHLIISIFVALVLSYISYRKTLQIKPPVRWSLAFIRFIIYTACLLLLSNFRIISNQYISHKPELVVLADNTSSITFMKQGQYTQNLVNQIKNDPTINNRFEVYYYRFSKHLSPYQNALDFTENQTYIEKHLSYLQKSFVSDGTTKTPVILITDGNQTQGNLSGHHSELDIFPVVIGDTIRHDDLFISKINYNKYSFLNNSFPVEIFLNYKGTHNINSELQIRHLGKTIYQQPLQFSRDNNVVRLSPTFQSKKIGLNTYTVRIKKMPQENNVINNTKIFNIEVIDEQMKIALISDIVHPDLRTLKESIESNKQRKIVFESPNISLSKLKKYDLAILYQPNSSFKNVYQYLEQTKKNYLLITGIHTNWAFVNSMEKEIDKAFIKNEFEEFNPLNTNTSSFPSPRYFPEYLSVLQGHFGDITFRTKHLDLLTKKIEGIQTSQPLVSQIKSIKQQKAYIFGQGLWRWRMFCYQKENSYNSFDKFIGQLLFQLDDQQGNSQIKLDYQKSYYQNSIEEFHVQVFDDLFNFNDKAQVIGYFTNIKSKKVYKKSFSLKNTQFTTQLNDLESGDYQFKITVDNNNTITNRNGAFKIIPFNFEKQNNTANLDVIYTLVQNDSDKVSFNFEQLSSKIANTDYLPTQEISKINNYIIDWKWLLIIIITAASIEWFLRKHWGLI